jgi:hypothetical protein
VGERLSCKETAHGTVAAGKARTVLNVAEVQQILDDTSKIIRGDLEWSIKADHPTWAGFLTPVESSYGYLLFLNASLNYEARRLSFALILRGERRIYGLCLGIGHNDPETGRRLDEKHKHRWTDRYADKSAYRPDDITADASAPDLAWAQFCREARIRHEGKLRSLPAHQMELS